MWRIFQGLPRAFRQQWNWTLRHNPAVCPEEEATKDQRECQLTPHRCIRAGAHRRHEKQQDHHGDGSRCEWQEWRQTFRQHFGGPVNHSPLEAVGWGTVLILGFQLSQLWRLSDQRDGGEHRRYRGVLYLLACSMPVSSDQSLLCNVKDTRRQHNTSKEEKEKEQVQLSFKIPTHKKVPSTSIRTSSLQERSTEEPVLTSSPSQLQILQSITCSGSDVYSQEEEANAGSNRTVLTPENLQQIDEVCSLCSAMIDNSQGLSSMASRKIQTAVEKWRSAGHAGNEDANYNLGLAYEKGWGTSQNLIKALDHYSAAAVEGHMKAQYNLAMLYLEGRDGVQQDTHRALRLLHRAAKSGLPTAQTQLGVLYTENERKNLRRAASWFQMAARQQDLEAQYYLGVCFEHGWGVTEDKVRAARWYSLAADAGHPTATYNLAVFHELGLGGIIEDQDKAVKLYQSAAEAGDKDALAAVDRITGNKGNIKPLTQEEKGIAVEPQEIPSFIVHSSSSPTLTDYMRGQLFDLDPDLDFSDSDSIATKSSSSEHPVFTIGDTSGEASFEDSESEFSVVFDAEYDVESLEDSYDAGVKPSQSLGFLGWEVPSLTQQRQIDQFGRLLVDPSGHFTQLRQSHSANELGIICTR